MIERIEIDIAQQRAYHGSLWRALFRHPLLIPVQNSLFKEALDQRHDAAIRHLLANQGQQAVLWDRIKVALEVDIDDVDVTSLEQFHHPPQRVLTSPFGAKAVAVRSEVPLEDGFQHHAKRRLYHPVSDRGYSQGTLLSTPQLGNVVPSDSLRPIVASSQLLAQALEICVFSFCECFDRNMIYSRSPGIGLHLRKGRLQSCRQAELIDQAVPFASFDPHFEGHQHPCRPNRWFTPRPVTLKCCHPWVLSDAVSHLRHSRRFLSNNSLFSSSVLLFCFVRSPRLHLPAPLRSPRVTRVHRSYECCDS